MADYCRDCLAELADGTARCKACGSPRLLHHPELNSLAIAHVDCDAFYAAVEKRDQPDLLHRPVIIGGGRRGVVSTACYVARTYGVRSAQPMFKALKACPNAVVIKPDMAKYVQVSGEIRSMMQELTPAMEPLSIDEAFLDLTGTERLHRSPPVLSLLRLQKRIADQIGISVSIGLSHNKFLAKIASDLDKPRGFAVIGQQQTQSFLAAQPISLIWGIGKAMTARLARDGLTRIEQLQQMDEKTLYQRYGVIGGRLYCLARGLDDRPVNTERAAKSISSETTLDRDLYRLGDLDLLLWRQAERVSASLKKKKLAGLGVVLKLKTADHHILTRSRHLSSPTQLADRLYETARPLLEKECEQGRAYRLIGIGVTDLVDDQQADPDDLADPSRARRRDGERAVDVIRNRFGAKAIGKGRGHSKGGNGH